ncbi:DNA-dependent metalloprotease WSS1-like [Syzygium oleosum]|uniref:DNA-dependent metalloprotease WSS1-like n=1 Tax=Syzygium oleosum TaxID=219896 RepID=UPI0024BB21EF|nr:DNA-dependent metalloprotease WSS1-like [Syzygium oleosum]XP_056167944.1 DNA-dependent metalloprotease WSS1-like [Syzygium oleosum]XP_056167945.1 DNA-dependent metalloprotease WSS1-like [Syzygium oleosum]
MDLNDLNKVWEIKPLKKIGEEDARKVLEKVAKQVQPIMRKRKWKVEILSEFCPPNPSLLGLNIGGGAEIKLRLRRPNNEWDFFPYEQILDTMLHELCHIEYGPHNTDFYNLLDEIRKECEELMAKGITGTGQGFDLPGRRLGGFSRQPPPSSLRQTALAAAENRARRGALLPSGPRRIGGDSDIRNALSPIQAAAMAAERRLRDELWCGSKSAEGQEGFQGRVGPSLELPEKSKASTSFAGISATTSRVNSTSSLEAADDEVKWQCNTCTLLNQPLALSCEACGSRKHIEVTTSNVWSCKFCTLDNSVKQDRCLACGEWRYSYGPPASSCGPYVGT